MIKPRKTEIQRHTYKAMISGRKLLITNIVLFTCLLFCSYSTHLFAVDIEISKFDIVSTNVSTNIVVTLVPSPVTDEEVCLNLRSTDGMGGVVFMPGGHTTTNISQTTTLRIIGNQLSSMESNMVLEAKIGETIVASNIFTVVDVVSESKATETMSEKKDKVKTKEAMITKSKATEIATEAIKGKMKIQEGAPITVELKGRDYIVTFGWIHPKGIKRPMPAPSYTAKVTLDAYTGSVKKMLGAP